MSEGGGAFEVDHLVEVHRADEAEAATGTCGSGEGQPGLFGQVVPVLALGGEVAEDLIEELVGQLENSHWL